MTHRPSAQSVSPHRPLFGLVLATFALVALPAPLTRAATVTLRPAKDTTIYGDGNASLSNGAGPVLFAGRSGAGRTLRTLIAFDLNGQIPAGATITAVSLSLTVNTPIGSKVSTVQVRRLLAEWGEGTSVAGSGGGGGATASTGDATWLARIFNTALWTNPGGDFASTVSASQSVGSSSTATFSASGMMADVQGWVNAPAANFGWILLAQNEADSAVRFASREGSPAPTLTVEFTPPGGGGGNVAPTFSTQPFSQSVTAGTAVTFSATVTGTPAPTLQWQRNGTAIPGATAATLTLPAVTSADAGSYALVATNAAGTRTSSVAALNVTTATSTGVARLSNLSVRTALAAGQTLFVGFSVSGGSRPLLLRGVGPTLTAFGLDGAMTDPRLELYNGSALVAENNDWGSSPALTNAFASVGAFALLPGSRDAALLQAVDGTRSVQLKGTGAGVALVELYDTGSGNSPRLVNVSARNLVGTGDNILIVGFFIEGTGPKNLLIRAVGPRLADLGVTGALADPRFEVFRAGSATAVAGNDNWDAALAPTFPAVGAFPLLAGSRDAALVTALAPGSYTVQVSGTGGATGEALVEIYEVP